MKQVWFFLVTLLVFLLTVQPTHLQAQTGSEKNYVVKINPIELEGHWFLVSTNLHPWKSPKKTNIRFDFSVNGDSISETIALLKSGKPVQTRLQVKVKGSAFFSEKTVSGKRLSKRNWYVVAMDEHKRWMVIYVRGKFLRKDAIQVISRDAQIPEDAKVRIRKLFEENYFLKAKTEGMRISIQRP